ncbi:MAG: hypothetical protein OXC46_00795 [Thaumarchaeota archaeon]|nr:hypothetical protein [Nitrososphaerota archaeon]
MSFPSGYDPTPLAPLFSISRRGEEILRWEHPQITDKSTTPRQDFEVESYALRTGVNTDAGNATITIPDHSESFAPTGISPIRPSDRLDISLGKDKDHITKYWTGEIKEVRVINNGTNQQHIEIACIGLINNLAYRFTTVDLIFESPAIDPTARITEIVKYIISGDGLLIPDTLDIDSIDIIPIDIRLTQYQHRNRSVKSIIADLAKLGSAVYGIDADKRFFFHLPYQSEFVVSSISDTDRTISNAYAQNVAYGVHNSQLTDGFGRSITFNADGSAYTFDQPNYTEYSDLASKNMINMRLQNITNKLHTISVRCKTQRTASTDDVLTSVKIWKQENPITLTEIVKDDESNILDLQPSNFNPPMTAKNELHEYFTELTGYDTRFRYFWLQIPRPSEWEEWYEEEKYYGLEIVPNQNIGFGINDDSTAEQNSAGTWFTLDWALRIFENIQVRLNGYNVHGSKKELIENAGKQLLGTSVILTEKSLERAATGRRVLDPINISPPDSRPPIGQRIKLIDSKGRISRPVLAGYDCSSSFSRRNVIHRMQLNLNEGI